MTVSSMAQPIRLHHDPARRREVVPGVDTVSTPTKTRTLLQ
ncbi:hypothetical protein HEP84_57930 [Streptomyces sp. RLB1-33]|nr:hypothetical protein [Streptomyces sp. RLB1-33]